MKLFFQIDNYDYQPQRYLYSVEQMMLMLFPGEKPDYPSDPFSEQENSACFSLHRGDIDTTITAQVVRNGQRESGAISFPSQELDLSPEQVYHSIQHALKLAFYQAGVAILGAHPPWGALTGVRPVKLPTKAMRQGYSPEAAQKELEQVYHVSPVRAKLATNCAHYSLSVEQTLSPTQVSLYIGIPFCPTRCSYCSFVSGEIGKMLHLVEPYLEHLEQELIYTGNILENMGFSIYSLYVGGGTPTVLSATQLDRLLSVAKKHLPLSGCIEYTVEAGRPDTITPEKLAVLRQHQIDRISINPQTLQDSVLETISRKHTAQDIIDTYQLARSMGFSSINMDLIAGLPGDTYSGFCQSLDGVLAMAPENITVHTLAMKKGSKLMESGCQSNQGDMVSQMLDYSFCALQTANYTPYYLYRQKYMSGSLENIGWCKPGTESVYNIVMMEELQTVLSVGGGGMTKLVNRSTGKILRLPNPKYPHDYLSGFEKVLAQKDQIPKFYQQ